MLLFIVYDKSSNKCTAPAIAEDISEATEALKLINPENINDLIIHPLCNLTSLYDLFLLTIDENLSLPDFILNRSVESTLSPTQQGEAAVGDLHETI